MSLKTRLRIAIVTLVTMLVLMQCIISLRIGAEATFTDALEKAQSIAQQVRHQVLVRVNEKAAAIEPRPSGMNELKRMFESIVFEDLALTELLEKTMASSNSIMEIAVCDENMRVLAASTPSRLGTTFQPLPKFEDWRGRPLWDRVSEVLTQRKDYSLVVPLTVPGMADPVLSIHVVVSTVLLRSAILPQVRSLLAVSLASLLGSMLLAALFSNFMLRSLERLGKRIEGITTGEFTEEESAEGKRESKEFADVQSKLDLLSRQFRGAREDVLQLRSNIERMLDRLEESVLLFDAEGKLIRASRTAGRLLQECDAGRRAHLEELFPEESPLGGLVHRALREGMGIRDAVVELPRENASPLRILVNVELLDNFPAAGKRGALLTLRDAEMRSQLRSQLDFSTRLTAMSRLTGGVAHEIKNPLNAIALHLEILRSKLTEHPEMRAEVEVIGSEIARLDRVVKTFLDFQRPVDLRMRPVNVVEVARQVSALLWPEAERAGVSVELDAPQKSIFLRADEDLLKQALLNVAANGIEAMSQGGRLRVQVGQGNEEVAISVSDQGPGIPPELQEKIFNLYFTTKPKGSGIGLAMTFRIVQLHNGSIDFTTQPGQGTTFRLRFPAMEEEGAEAGALTGADHAQAESVR